MKPFIAQVDIGDSFQRMWNTAVELIPQILLFIIILIVGFIVAKVVANVLDSILDRVGFDRWVERGGVKRALQQTTLDASDLLAKVVYYALVLVTLQLAFGVFGDNPVSDMIEGIVSYLPNIFVAILIIVVAAYIASAVRDLARAALSSVEYGRELATASYVAILGIGVFAALDQLDIAEDIVNGLFYAILAIIAGSLIVAVGGGGIEPMRDRWHRFLDKGETEAAKVSGERRVSSSQTGSPLSSNDPVGPGEELPPQPRSVR